VQLLRPWGVISSVGVHNGEIPWTGNEAYNKNIRVQMGRCPVRSVFEEALESLQRHQDKLGYDFPIEAKFFTDAAQFHGRQDNAVERSSQGL
jgi:threonine dehydrogenase-like Zn-dependent dehydrogenase